MARATTTKTPARKLRAKVEEAPRRKPGRPVGSTNAKRAATSAAKIAKPPVKRATVAKTTRVTKPVKAMAPAPKMSKADLELHVVKLERTIARLREKNKELKVATPKTPTPVEISAPKPAAVEVKPARKTRRSAKSVMAHSTEPTSPEE